MILLLPSPLLGPATWRPVEEWLRAAGADAVAVDLGRERRTPARVLAAVAAAADAAGGSGLVLVPHSNAGLYAPQLGAQLDVRATVYVDAALPDAGSDTPLAPPSFLAFLRDLADPDGVLPPWTHWWGDATHLFPDAATRHAVEREQQRLPLAYFVSRVPVPAGWTERPAAYLAFGDTYADERALAASHGWPVRTVAGGTHLHQLHDSAGVGRAILDLLSELG